MPKNNYYDVTNEKEKTIQFLPMSQHTRQVLLYKDEDGYWIAECPSLKGCNSQGKTKEEALSNIKEAIVGYVAALEEDGIFQKMILKHSWWLCE